MEDDFRFHDHRPARPVRRGSRNPEVARFVTDGIPQMLFTIIAGAVFLLSGGFFVVAPMNTISRFFANSEEGIGDWTSTAFVASTGLCGMLIGALVLVVGMARGEWLTIDRLHGIATKQTAILCFRRMATGSLGDYTGVSVFAISTTWRERASLGNGDLFEVVLTGPNDKRFPLGRVTLSYDLAREFAQEVASYLGLPLH